MTTHEKLEELINAGERDDRCSGSFADELRVITAGMKVAQSAEAAEARVAELTRERDALDANRNRLIAVINSNLDERDEARAQVIELTNQVRLLQAHPSERYWEGRWRDADAQATALTAENAVLREALERINIAKTISYEIHEGADVELHRCLLCEIA